MPERRGWLRIVIARRWLLVMGAGAVVVAAGASVAVALSGTRAPVAPAARPAGPTTAAHRVAMPAQCASWHCTPAASADLGNGYAITLWRAGSTRVENAEPVIELRQNATSVQWWIWTQGYGWLTSLRCEASASPPNCVVSDTAGAHAGVAQLLLLRDGRLVAPRAASLTADLPAVTARDLNDDGYLDVIAQDSDYTPNFAQGHVYWHSYVYRDGRYVSTGCERRSSPSTPAPAGPLTGACPHR